MGLRRGAGGLIELGRASLFSLDREARSPATQTVISAERAFPRSKTSAPARAKNDFDPFLCSWDFLSLPERFDRPHHPAGEQPAWSRQNIDKAERWTRIETRSELWTLPVKDFDVANADDAVASMLPASASVALHKVLTKLVEELRGTNPVPAESENEAQVIQGLISGRREAFETVYRRHNASMIRVASAILRNRASAEEITQETWIAVLRNIGGFEGRSSLAGWIFTILANKAKTRAKRDGRSVSLDTSANDNSLDDAFDGRGRWRDLPDLWDEMTPERIVGGRQVLDHVKDAIDNLPPAQRAVLVLRGQQDLESDEVCEILGITEGNMRVLLHRARLSLRGSVDKIKNETPKKIG